MKNIGRALRPFVGRATIVTMAIALVISIPYFMSAEFSTDTLVDGGPGPVSQSQSAKSGVSGVKAGQQMERAVPLMGMFDKVGLYQKNGSVENYGVSIRQRHDGPISVSQTELHFYAERAAVFWKADHFPADTPTHISLTFDEDKMPSKGSIRVGFILTDGRIFTSTATLPRAQNANAEREILSAPSEASRSYVVSEEYQAAFNGQATIDTGLMRTLPNGFESSLRDEVREALGSNGNTGGGGPSPKVSDWFILFDGVPEEMVSVVSLELIGIREQPAYRTTVQLSGRVELDTGAESSSEILLLREDGTEERSPLSQDGQFSFADVEIGSVVSLRYRHKNQDYYAQHGRWIEVTREIRDAVISVKPRFANPDGIVADLSQNVSSVVAEENEFGSVWQPHTRRRHVHFLPDKIQEYDGLNFVNQRGYYDRDRFFDNPDDCVRVVVLGTSNLLAVQVPLFQKFNMLLESELAVRLGRCVEAPVAGTDGNPLSDNNFRIKNYAVRFAPDLILMETASFSMMSAPHLSWKYSGIDPEHTPFDTLLYDEDGALQFKRKDPLWIIHSRRIEGNIPSIMPAIPFFWSLWVPFSVMPAEAVDTFAYHADVMRYFQSSYPRERFVLFSPIEQIRSDYPSQLTVQGEDGKPFTYGTEQLIQNVRQFCTAESLSCVVPDLPDATYRETDALLTWHHDAHPSPLGHQWLAETSIGPLAEEIAKCAAMPDPTGQRFPGFCARQSTVPDGQAAN